MKVFFKYFFMLMIGTVTYPYFSIAQSVGNPVITSTRTVLTLGISGEISRFNSDGVEMKSQKAMLKLSLPILPGVDVFGRWGKGNLTFSDSTHGVDGFQFEPEFIYGGGLQWNFFCSPSKNMSLIWQTQALWFNPDGTKRFDDEKKSIYLIFEGWELQTGVVAVVRNPRLDFYFGAEGRGCPYQLKMQTTDAQGVRVSQWKKKDRLHLGYFLGVDFKLTGNIRTSVEVKNSNLCDFNLMLGISQIGPP